MKITIPTDKYITREIEVDNVEFISPTGGNDLPCTGGDHKHVVGEDRPIAIVWAEGRGWRLCRKCSKHLEQPDLGSCSSCGETVEFGGMEEHNKVCPEKGKDNEA